jgi:hypothetical protein
VLPVCFAFTTLCLVAASRNGDSSVSVLNDSGLKTECGCLFLTDCPEQSSNSLLTFSNSHSWFHTPVTIVTNTSTGGWVSVLVLYTRARWATLKSVPARLSAAYMSPSSHTGATLSHQAAVISLCGRAPGSHSGTSSMSQH